MVSYDLSAKYSGGGGTLTKDSVHFLRLVASGNQAVFESGGNLCRHFEMGLLNGIKAMMNSLYIPASSFQVSLLIRMDWKGNETALRNIVDYVGTTGIVSEVVDGGVRLYCNWNDFLLPSSFSLLHKIVRDGFVPDKVVKTPHMYVIDRMMEADNGMFSANFYSAAYLHMRAEWNSLPFVWSTGPGEFITKVGTHTGWVGFLIYVRKKFPEVFRRMENYTSMVGNRLSAYKVVKEMS